jgi:hypothetical protein
MWEGRYAVAGDQNQGSWRRYRYYSGVIEGSTLGAVRLVCSVSPTCCDSVGLAVDAAHMGTPVRRRSFARRAARRSACPRRIRGHRRGQSQLAARSAPLGRRRSCRPGAGGHGPCFLRGALHECCRSWLFRRRIGAFGLLNPSRLELTRPSPPRRANVLTRTRDRGQTPPSRFARMSLIFSSGSR